MGANLIKKIFNGSFFFCLLWLNACQSVPRVPPSHPLPDHVQSQQTLTLPPLELEETTKPFGPVPLSPQLPLGEQSPPIPPSLRESISPIVLVLGPGLARGFAHLGVLQALERAKVPIAAIFGTEMGALFGAMYATTSTLSQLEWTAQYFQADCFLKKGFLFTSGPQEGTKLIQQLQKVFGTKELQGTKIPFQLALESKMTGMPIIAKKGPLVPLLRGALGTPSLFLPYSIQIGQEELSVIAANRSLPFLIQEALKLQKGKVVVVNVLKSAETSFWTELLAQAHFVLTPDLKEFEYTDYHKKNEIIYRGKKQVQEKWKVLKESLQLEPSPPTIIGEGSS